MRFTAQRPGRSRRGLTLLEMLVTLALLLLIMTIVVQIFQSATGAMSASRTYQELDQGLRRLDSTIRQDLKGVTAKMTPPNDPKDHRGYFEYAENAFADNQGEDADDTLRFTAKAPENQPFTGRVLIPGATVPILITSQHAEIIYFLRNGNLYRRVLLIAPERQASLSLSTQNFIDLITFHGVNASWLGVNDLSARPSPVGITRISPPDTTKVDIPILNTLASLTNRENRAFTPRFTNDFITILPTFANTPDGIPDDADRNTGAGLRVGNGVPDYYPTLYPLVTVPLPDGTLLVNEDIATAPSRNRTLQVMPFPYIYPGAYSKPDPSPPNPLQGWIHSLDPTPPTATITPSFNHAPLDQGDSLAVPGTGGGQTWWGFPTWRETMDRDWTDPTFKVNTAGAASTQSWGLRPFDPTKTPNYSNDENFLPPVRGLLFAEPPPTPLPAEKFDVASSAIWEDDLIMTGVRSFDIKAYDNAFAGYVDLGWGDDVRLSGGTTDYLTKTPTPTPYNTKRYNTLLETYAHEGRIPPLTTDLRFDPQFSSSNIGDDREDVIRLRRVWDSWSTDYTHAPGSGHDPQSKQPTGLPFFKPIYPSYPAPYPMPLRGLQIQIRVVDPRNERIKTLTIRQDFSDKL